MIPAFRGWFWFGFVVLFFFLPANRNILTINPIVIIIIEPYIKNFFFPCNENFLRVYSLFFKKLYLFLAVLGLHCCTWAFFVVGEGYSSAHRFSSCGAPA